MQIYGIKLDKLDSNLNDDQCKNLRFLKRRQRFLRFWAEEVYIRTCIWTARKSLLRQSYHWKMHFTASWTWKVSVIKGKNMHRKFNRIAPEFENVTFRDYCDVYLAKDVLLLVDEFETFLNTCLKHLDPAPF